MATFCLTKQTKEDFKKALKTREIDPVKLSEMTSRERHDFLSSYVGKENAQSVNALFESKLLLKNQKAGYISWAKKVAGISAPTRRDMIARIERLETVLSPTDEKAFLQDLASTRLGIGVSLEEARNISELSKNARQLKAKANEDGTFASEQTRLSYGAAKVALESYVNDLKLQSKAISLREQPIRKIVSAIKESPGVLKSVLASLDNSFWGRQGIKTLLDARTSAIWARNFIKSWGDIGRQLVGKDVVAAIKADIYSRPNALNGKYDAGNYGLSVLSEEAFPSSLPEKIPVLGRLFKASEAAYNGAALRLRADLADRLIRIAEKQGINTLNKDEAAGMGRLVNSLTGRGSLGKGDVLAKEANALLFSIKFLKSNFDTLTAHQFDSKATSFTKKEAAKSLLSIVTSVASVLTIAKVLDPDSVEEDPRSPNFGKIKVFGHWTDITGGMAGLLTLAARLTPTYHNGKLGFWTKNKMGDYKSLTNVNYGESTALDVFENFWEGKLSPAAGLVRDVWTGKDFQGNPLNPVDMAKRSLTPLAIQSFENLKNDPSSSFLLGSLILEGLGFSTSTSPQPNSKTNLIPEGKHIKSSDFIDQVQVYAKAIGTDPETAFNRIFTGQTIRKVSNGTVIVERMSLSESQAIKRKKNAANPTMKLDHVVPLQLGGSNDKENLRLVTTAKWRSYTKTENILGRALENKKISKKEAQDLIKRFKAGQVSADAIAKKYR